MRRLVVSSIAVLVFSAWSLPAEAGGYSAAEIVKVAKQLAKKREMDKDKTRLMVKNLKSTLDDKWFKKVMKERPVKGVFVYRAGEGGFLVKFMKGDGYISFKGGKQKGRIWLKSWSVGAQAGGSSVWGVGLVMGLKKQTHFGGTYVGKTQGATAAEESTPGAVVLTLDDEEKKNHDVALIIAAAGLSAGVGGEKMTITPDW